MALQTNTVISSDSSTPLNSNIPTGFGQGNNNGFNQNRGISSGPTPLIPAFVLSGMLITGIILMCWWRRLSERRSPHNLTANGITVIRQTTVFSFPQPPVTTGSRKGKAKLGPKPKMWDIHLPAKMVSIPDTTKRWKDLKPLSAEYLSTLTGKASLSAIPDVGNPNTASRTAGSRQHVPNHLHIDLQQQPRRQQQQQQLESSSSAGGNAPRPLARWREKFDGPKPKITTIATTLQNPDPGLHHLRVSVVISMPLQHQRKSTSSLSTDNDEGNGLRNRDFLLGVADVTYQEDGRPVG